MFLSLKYDTSPPVTTSGCLYQPKQRPSMLSHGSGGILLLRMSAAFLARLDAEAQGDDESGNVYMYA